MKSKKLLLDGGALTIEKLQNFFESPDSAVELKNDQLKFAAKSYRMVNDLKKERLAYGINTGFGPMASYVLGREQLVDLQYNLIRSHAVGMGEPVSSKFVLSAMIIRLNTLLKGYSGVSLDLLLGLRDLINSRIVPVVPEHGAVGTSGDLVQLAHIAQVLIGEGEVFYESKRMQTSVAFKKAQLKPYKLKPKEGLALINGTSMMTGIAAVLVIEAQNLFKLALESGACALEIVNAFEDSISEKLHALRPHPGQQKVAEILRDLLADSSMLRRRHEFSASHVPEDDVKKIDEFVQEVYSLRCIPQILGPLKDTLDDVVSVVEVEMNAVTDNPIVDVDEKRFLHGGNFHGEYIANAMDKLKIVFTKMSLLSERRINFFLNASVNKSFPPFLNLEKPGLTLALQAMQFVATSTAADNQSLSFPHAVHSISTNADNQDVVSMGSDAALFTAKVLDNCYVIQSIEFITLMQAVDVKGEVKKYSKNTKLWYEKIRKIFPKIIADRVLNEELKAVLNFIKGNNHYANFKRT